MCKLSFYRLTISLTRTEFLKHNVVGSDIQLKSYIRFLNIPLKIYTILIVKNRPMLLMYHEFYTKFLK